MEYYLMCIYQGTLLVFTFQPRLILVCFNGVVITMLIPRTSRRLREQQQQHLLCMNRKYQFGAQTLNEMVFNNTLLFKTHITHLPRHRKQNNVWMNRTCLEIGEWMENGAKSI